MLSELLQKASLFFLLYRIDLDLAEQVQSKGCPFCHCPLHHANYTRKPRGGPVNIPDEYLIRQSLCCSNPECRRRTMPPSSLASFISQLTLSDCLCQATPVAFPKPKKI